MNLGISLIPSCMKNNSFLGPNQKILILEAPKVVLIQGPAPHYEKNMESQWGNVVVIKCLTELRTFQETQCFHYLTFCELYPEVKFSMSMVPRKLQGASGRKILARSAISLWSRMAAEDADIREGWAYILAGIALNKRVEIHPCLCFSIYVFSSIQPFIKYQRPIA